MQWNFDAKQPIYLQIVDALTRSILRGEYPPGSRLPSVRELAFEASVNPNTMQRAMTELETRQLAETKRNTCRTVTSDEAVIGKTRKEEAGTLTRAYLDDMDELGMQLEQTLELVAELGKKGN